MTWSRDDFEVGKLLRRGIKDDLSRFKTTMPQKNKTRPKIKRKRNGQNPGCYKPTPLKEISSSRFGCSGVKHKYTHLRKPFPTRVSFLPLYYAPAGYSDGLWFVSLNPYSDRFFLIYNSDFNPFMPVDLPKCDELS